ncbi:T9SS type A sorting domain-containing protein [bacterium]|nr:T9SS type A sorting domain-containing protein [bacterium]
MKRARFFWTLMGTMGCLFVALANAETTSAADGATTLALQRERTSQPLNPLDTGALDADPDDSDTPVSVELIPDLNSLTIPPHGGTLGFGVHVTNASYRVLTVEYSTYVRLPSGGLFGPTSVETIPLVPGMDQTFSGLSQDVPQAAPAGLYEFIVQLRQGERTIEDSFLFVKSGVPGSPRAYDLDEWKESASSIQFNPLDSGTERPSSYGLHGPYANPDTSSPEFTVTLPKESDLTVRVYNTTGQVVTDLARGRFPAGELTLTFDAHRLAGGVYFVTAEVPEKFDSTKKVVLR